jgi:nucleoside-diphosphate-sugar epimerase
MALEYAEKHGLHVVTFCPGAVFGPLLQSDVLNITTKFLRYVIKGSLLVFAYCFQQS